MNCKPQQLAYVATTLGYPFLNHCLGEVVTTLYVFEDRPPFGPMWKVEHSEMEGVADACLRPMTPPPGTITDEEVRDLYAPKQPEAA